MMLEIPRVKDSAGDIVHVEQGEVARRRLRSEPSHVTGFRVDPVKFIGQVTAFFFPLWLRLGLAKGKLWPWQEVNVRNVCFQVITQKKLLARLQLRRSLPEAQLRGFTAPWKSIPCPTLRLLRLWGHLSPLIICSRKSRGGDQLGQAMTPN